MQLKNVLLVVRDIEKSKQFYQEFFGLCVLRDFGENVILTEGLVLQEQKTWEQLIHAKTMVGNAGELFFEESRFDEFLANLNQHPEVVRVGELWKNSWGKRAIMLCDPDGHLVEVAEA